MNTAQRQFVGRPASVHTLKEACRLILSFDRAADLLAWMLKDPEGDMPSFESAYVFGGELSAAWERNDFFPHVIKGPLRSSLEFRRAVGKARALVCFMYALAEFNSVAFTHDPVAQSLLLIEDALAENNLEVRDKLQPDHKKLFTDWLEQVRVARGGEHLIGTTPMSERLKNKLRELGIRCLEHVPRYFSSRQQTIADFIKVPWVGKTTYRELLGLLYKYSIITQENYNRYVSLTEHGVAKARVA